MSKKQIKSEKGGKFGEARSECSCRSLRCTTAHARHNGSSTMQRPQRELLSITTAAPCFKSFASKMTYCKSTAVQSTSKASGPCSARTRAAMSLAAVSGASHIRQVLLRIISGSCVCVCLVAYHLHKPAMCVGSGAPLDSGQNVVKSQDGKPSQQADMYNTGSHLHQCQRLEK